MKLEQVLYADDFEITIRTRDYDEEEVVTKVKQIYDMIEMAKAHFKIHIDEHRAYRTNNNPTAVLAVNIGAFGFRFRIFSKDKDRMIGMFNFLQAVKHDHS